MTWNDDRYRVAAIRRADRARGFRIADPPRQFAVTHRRTVGNPSQLSPDALLKRRAAGRKGQIELGQFAREICPKLISGLPEQSVIAPPIADRLRPAFMLFHKQLGDRLSIRREKQFADRTVECGVENSGIHISFSRETLGAS